MNLEICIPHKKIEVHCGGVRGSTKTNIKALINNRKVIIIANLHYPYFMIRYTMYYERFSKDKFQMDAAWCASNAYVAVDSQAMHALSCTGKTAVKIKKKYF